MAEVVTFGCKLNLYESEAIKNYAKNAGLDSKTFIINTCSVTLEAEKDALKQIRKIKRESPDAKIIVTGCAAQINPEKFAKLEDVDLLLGNKEKMKEESYHILKRKEDESYRQPQSSYSPRAVYKYEDKLFFKERPLYNNEKTFVEDIFLNDEGEFKDIVSSFESNTRAFVQIQTGCNHRCTFCIIPFARGNSRSVPFGVIYKEVKALVENGYKEIVLTGVDITDYGSDLSGELNLGSMVKRLLKLIPDLKRLRLSSIDVAEVNREIYDLVANEQRFMPYFHISLQSGDDLILKRMKRRHKRADVIEFVKKVKHLRPNATFGADIIAGFPTETEDCFNNSRSIIQEAELSFCHIFSFSPHDGTPAGKMPQVAKHIIKQRTNILINEGKKQFNNTLQSMIGSTSNVLCEANQNVRCENFVLGKLNNVSRETLFKRGEIITAKATSIENGQIIFEAM